MSPNWLFKFSVLSTNSSAVSDSVENMSFVADFSSCCFRKSAAEVISLTSVFVAFSDNLSLIDVAFCTKTSITLCAYFRLSSVATVDKTVSS